MREREREIERREQRHGKFFCGETEIQTTIRKSKWGVCVRVLCVCERDEKDNM